MDNKNDLIIKKNEKILQLENETKRLKELVSNYNQEIMNIKRDLINMCNHNYVWDDALMAGFGSYKCTKCPSMCFDLDGVIY